MLSMKNLNIFLITVCSFTLMACGDEKSDTNPTASKIETAVAPTAAEEQQTPSYDHPDYKIGLELVAKSDCWSCHKINETSIGPSYKDVAAKYEPTQSNYEMLAGKIIKGGKGNWGEVPMNPHPDISTEDAIAMTKYILLLKEKK